MLTFTVALFIACLIYHWSFIHLFCIARIAGWSAHRIEELINANKIIRPAYKAVNI